LADFETDEAAGATELPGGPGASQISSVIENVAEGRQTTFRAAWKQLIIVL